MRAVRRRLALVIVVPIVALAVGATAGCDVRLDATQVTVDFQDGGGVLLVSVKNVPSAFSDKKELPGGETVITVVNRDTHNSHRIMLAKVGVTTPQALPQRLLQARFVSDDPDQILELSESLKPDEMIASNGSFTETDPTTVFHDYLIVGQRYMILDPSTAQRFYLVIQPRQVP